MALVAERGKRLVVIMVGRIVTVTVHRPVEVFLKPMRMPVIGNHLEVILDRLENGRRMGRGRRDGPDHQRQAEKRRKRLSSICRQGSHRS